MYIVIGTSVVRVVATFESPEDAAALASRWNSEDKGEGHVRREVADRELFKVDI